MPACPGSHATFSCSHPRSSKDISFVPPSLIFRARNWCHGEEQDQRYCENRRDAHNQWHAALENSSGGGSKYVDEEDTCLESEVTAPRGGARGRLLVRRRKICDVQQADETCYQAYDRAGQDSRGDTGEIQTPNGSAL